MALSIKASAREESSKTRLRAQRWLGAPLVMPLLESSQVASHVHSGTIVVTYEGADKPVLPGNSLRAMHASSRRKYR